MSLADIAELSHFHEEARAGKNGRLCVHRVGESWWASRIAT